MKRIYLAALAGIGLTGCMPGGPNGPAIAVDDKTNLVVNVEGGETRGLTVANPAPGEPIHRVLENSDGKVLFAYDVEIGKSGADGSYRLILKPAQQKPTVTSAREVIFKAHQDSVRVELMEKPGTGEKIVDVFSLAPRTVQEKDQMGPLAHVRAMHNAFFHWIHGK